MRALATPVECERDDLLDTAGTGGGRRDLQRLDDRGADRRRAPAARWPSTATARRPACRARPTCSRRSARASTSRPTGVARCIAEAGFGFMFAPAHHQATRFVVPVRKELAVRTIFNFLGPLTNPAGARRQLIGVADPAFLDVMAGALARLGIDRALLVSSADGLDEMSTSGATHVVEVNGTTIERYDGDAAKTSACPSRLVRRRRRAARPQQNAATTRAILAGEPGPRARPRRAQRRRGDLRRRPRREPRRRRRGGRRGRRLRAPRPRRLERYVAARATSWRACCERARPDRRRDPRRGPPPQPRGAAGRARGAPARAATTGRSPRR